MLHCLALSSIDLQSDIGQLATVPEMCPVNRMSSCQNEKNCVNKY